jgi:hypothetical protein
MTKAEKRERKSSAEGRLRQMFPSGTTIYSIQVRVSGTGMAGYYRFFVVLDNRPRDITALVSDVTGHTWKEDGSLRVRGCGYNRAAHVVDCLGLELHQDIRAFTQETF